jgi:hypothetical protein
MPQLSREPHMPEKGMRNRQCLPKLGPVHNSAIVDLLSDNSIRVDVKLLDIKAHQQQGGLAIGANVQLRCGAPIEPTEVADRNGGTDPFAGMEYCLKSRENLARLRVIPIPKVRLHFWFGLDHEFEAALKGELDHLFDSGTIGELSRLFRTQHTCFELEIANRR